MKCNNCGADWGNSDSFSVCPLCGETLQETSAFCKNKHFPSSPNKQFDIKNGVLVKYCESWSPVAKEVGVPEGVTVIGEGAFQGRDDICSVTVPQGVVRIEANAFEDCPNLHSLYVPNTLKYVAPNIVGDEIGWLPGVFSTESGEELLGWPETWHLISTEDLRGNVTPDDNKVVDDMPPVMSSAQESSENIQATDSYGPLSYDPNRFIFSDDEPDVLLEYIGDDAVVSIPYGTKSIAKKAFYKRKHLTHVRLPETIQTIGERAFSHCKRLEEINLPQSLRYIGESAFSDCSSALKEFGLKSIEIPSGVRTIPRFCFACSFNLKKVVIQNGVQHIDDYAFHGCKIEDFYIPESIEYISPKALSKDCPIKNVYLLPAHERLDENRVKQLLFREIP